MDSACKGIVNYSCKYNLLCLVQGAYEAQHKVAEQWQPLLQHAQQGSLPALLDSHAVRQQGAGGRNATGQSFLGTLAPEVAGTGYRIVIDAHFPLVHNSSAGRLGLGGEVAGYEPAEAAAADWGAPLQGLFGKGIVLRPEGRTHLAVSCEPHLLQAGRSFHCPKSWFCCSVLCWCTGTKYAEH